MALLPAAFLAGSALNLGSQIAGGFASKRRAKRGRKHALRALQSDYDQYKRNARVRNIRGREDLALRGMSGGMVDRDQTNAMRVADEEATKRFNEGRQQIHEQMPTPSENILNNMSYAGQAVSNISAGLHAMQQPPILTPEQVNMMGDTSMYGVSQLGSPFAGGMFLPYALLAQARMGQQYKSK